jgi:hypothetical protein
MYQSYLESVGRYDQGYQILKSFVHFMTGVIFMPILSFLNKFKSYDRKYLIDNLWNRKQKQGLLSVSNHQGFFDDPGLWSAIIPWWKFRPDQMRWALCSHENFFMVSLTHVMLTRSS